MTILRIEHQVPDYEAWKRAFDSDPAGRQRAGVRRYQILRPVDDPGYVLIDLEFDDPAGAEALLAGLRVAWKDAEGRIMSNPQTRVVEAVETKEC